MEINRIKYFRTVFEVRSIRKASEILHITPGALSKSMKVLEEELENALFLPDGRNIVPSDFGKKFYHLSENLVNAHSKLSSELNSLETQDSFTIATWEVFSSYFCSIFAQIDFEDMALRVIERVPNELENSILDGVADVGITYAPIPHPELEFVKVGQIEYDVHATKNSFLDCKVSEIPFSVPITIFPESPTGVKTLDNWPSECERKVVFQFELLETALEVARFGKAAIFCPTFLIGLQNKTLLQKHRLYPVKKNSLPKVKRSVYLVKRKSIPNSKGFEELRKVLKEVILYS
jgi:DNA-binding transcriptional LysR family regulator